MKGSVVNDLSLSTKWGTSANRLSLKAGLFYMDQTIDQNWHPNASLATISGTNPAGLNLISTSGQLPYPGQLPYSGQPYPGQPEYGLPPWEPLPDPGAGSGADVKAAVAPGQLQGARQVPRLAPCGRVRWGQIHDVAGRAARAPRSGPL